MNGPIDPHLWYLAWGIGLGTAAVCALGHRVVRYLRWRRRWLAWCRTLERREYLRRYEHGDEL